MNTLIKQIRDAMKQTELTQNYENLYQYAYSDNMNIRFLFMDLLLLNNNNLSIKRLYKGNITNYFFKCDVEGNITEIMSYEHIRELADRARTKNDAIHKQIVNFIIKAYILRQESIRKENAKEIKL